MGGTRTMRQVRVGWDPSNARMPPQPAPQTNLKSHPRTLPIPIFAPEPTQVASHVQKYFIKLAKQNLPIPGRMHFNYQVRRRPPPRRPCHRPCDTGLTSAGESCGHARSRQYYGKGSKEGLPPPPPRPAPPSTAYASAPARTAPKRAASSMPKRSHKARRPMPDAADKTGNGAAASSSASAADKANGGGTDDDDDDDDDDNDVGDDDDDDDGGGAPGSGTEGATRATESAMGSVSGTLVGKPQPRRPGSAVDAVVHLGFKVAAHH